MYNEGKQLGCRLARVEIVTAGAGALPVQAVIATILLYDATVRRGVIAGAPPDCDVDSTRERFGRVRRRELREDPHVTLRISLACTAVLA